MITNIRIEQTEDGEAIRIRRDGVIVDERNEYEFYLDFPIVARKMFGDLLGEIEIEMVEIPYEEWDG